MSAVVYALLKNGTDTINTIINVIILSVRRVTLKHNNQIDGYKVAPIVNSCNGKLAFFIILNPTLIVFLISLIVFVVF